MFSKIFPILLVILIYVVVTSYGQRTKDKMYIEIKSSTGCYRRMNGTHQIGCTSKRGGSNGVIHYCDTEKDLNFILKNGIAGPYIPILPNSLLTLKVMNKLRSNLEIISGLIVHKMNDSHPNHFTHDDQCPNDAYGLEGTCSTETTIWNPYGTGLLFSDIPFPLFFVEEDGDVIKMRDCFKKFNNFSYDTQIKRSLCSLQLKSFMYGATSTPTCRRRSNKETNINPVKFCDPLGDYNIWSSLYPVVTGPKNESKPIKNSSYIIISARMDTTSLFEKTAGAHSPVTGIVTLLGVAKYLKTILPKNPNIEKNVLFIIFNGETYDYIGSQRMLYDMKSGNFPVKTASGENDFLPVIKPEDISLFIELSQLKYSHSLNVHYFKDSEKIQDILKNLETNKGNLSITGVPNSLPPASLHTFLKHNPNVTGIVISDHSKSYINPYYNSIHDNSSNIDYKYYNVSSDDAEIPADSIQRNISNVATVVAKAVYQELKGEVYSGSEKLDVGLIDELLHCYLEDPNCRVHSVINVTKLQKSPFSLYVGIDNHNNFLTPLVALTLGWMTGDQEGAGDVNCTNKPRNYAYKYFNMSNSIYDLNNISCYKITFNQTEAVSPAFLIDDYDWKSGEFSTWSESTWEEISMRIFLKPSPTHEKITITIGSLSMIFSFFVVYFFKSRSHVLFVPVVPSQAPTEC